MARHDIFAMRVNQSERQMLEKLSKRLQRTQSDTVRLLIRNTAYELGLVEDEQKKEQTNEQ